MDSYMRAGWMAVWILQELSVITYLCSANSLVAVNSRYSFPPRYNIMFYQTWLCFVSSKRKYVTSTCHVLFFIYTGDMEFKQNKFLPADKQIVTANPDVNTVCTVSFVQYLGKLQFSDLLLDFVLILFSTASCLEKHLMFFLWHFVIIFC